MQDVLVMKNDGYTEILLSKNLLMRSRYNHIYENLLYHPILLL